MRFFCGKQKITFSIKEEKSCLYYVALVAEESTVFYRGTIETEEQGKQVQLAVVTCTYNRKEALKRNMCLLQEENHVDKQVQNTSKKENLKRNMCLRQEENVNEEVQMISQREISERNVCLRQENANEEIKMILQKESVKQNLYWKQKEDIHERNLTYFKNKNAKQITGYESTISKIYVVDNARNITKE